MACSLAQIGTSFGGFLAASVAAYFIAEISAWGMLPFTVLAAGFLVRIFIIQHDCGHGSFFRSRMANETVGRLCSLLTLAPYAFWRRQHAAHHGSWNNLDRRAASGVDIYSSCLTVNEYRSFGRWRRLRCRLVRHPLTANLLLPPLIFLLLYRVPFDTKKGWRRERWEVVLTDFSIASLIVGLGLVVGYDRLAAVQLPIMVLASVVGVFLFSIQHRFEETLWTANANWNFVMAALHGSSHFRLPRVLQWFTGNIGFHHVHHLYPRIPNYRLEQCHDADVALQSAPALTLRTALATLRYALWDEERGRMVPFPSFKAPRATTDPSVAGRLHP